MTATNEKIFSLGDVMRINRRVREEMTVAKRQRKTMRKAIVSARPWHVRMLRKAAWWVIRRTAEV